MRRVSRLSSASSTRARMIIDAVFREGTTTDLVR